MCEGVSGERLGNGRPPSGFEKQTLHRLLLLFGSVSGPRDQNVFEPAGAPGGLEVGIAELRDLFYPRITRNLRVKNGLPIRNWQTACFSGIMLISHKNYFVCKTAE